MIDPNYGIKLIKLVDVSANPIRSTTQSKKSEFMGNRVSSNIAREFNLLSLRDPYTQDRIRSRSKEIKRKLIRGNSLYCNFEGKFD